MNKRDGFVAVLGTLLLASTTTLAVADDGAAPAGPSVPASSASPGKSDVPPPPPPPAQSAPILDIPSLPIVADSRAQYIIAVCSAATSLAVARPAAEAPAPAAAPVEKPAARGAAGQKPAAPKLAAPAPAAPADPAAAAAAAPAMKDAAALQTMLKAASSASSQFRDTSGVQLSTAAILAASPAAQVKAACDRLLSPTLTDDDIAFLRGAATSGATDVNSLSRLAKLVQSANGSLAPKALGDAARVAAAGGETQVTTPAAFLGDLQSNIINGLADFVVTRAKAEADLYLRQQLGDTLCKAGSDTAPYLPHFCTAITKLNPDMTLSAMGAYLKAAALQDLRRMPEVALELHHAETNDASSTVLFALVFIREVTAGRMPLDVIWSTKGLTCASPGKDSFSAHVDDATCGGASLVYGIVSQTGWVDDTSSAARRYLSLGATLGYEAQAVPAKTLTTDDFNTLSPIALGLVPLAQKLDQSQSDAASAKDAPSRASARLNMLADAMSITLRAASAGGAGAGAALGAFDRAISYTSAVGGSDVGGMVVAGQDLLTSVGVALPDGLAKVVGFVAEVANASSSKDVASAIDAAVAPVGSYKAKYQRDVIAVNAFVGGAVGDEWVQVNGNWTGAGAAGVFAPVGIEASGHVCPLLHAGVFLSVLDLGNLVSTRLSTETSTSNGQSTTVGQQASVTLDEVVAPGLYVSLGLFGSPITLLAGGEVTPNLRPVTTSNSSGAVVSTQNAAALRAQAALSMDLTLLPF